MTPRRIAPDLVMRIVHRPPDAPNMTFIECPELGLGIDTHDPDEEGSEPGRFGFLVETWEEPGDVDGELKWCASIGIEGAGPPYGEGSTELAAVVDLRRALLDVLRGDLAAFLAAWAAELVSASREAEDDVEDEGKIVERSDMLYDSAVTIEWVAQLMRAQAKLRELDLAVEGSGKAGSDR